MWKRAALLDFDGVQEPQMNEIMPNTRTEQKKRIHYDTSIGPMNKSDEQIFDVIVKKNNQQKYTAPNKKRITVECSKLFRAALKQCIR